jgi:vacuolar-type H+-ATPase subunit H
MTERALLQSIRERELEASVQLDAARREGAELVEAAKSDAAGILRAAEEEAARAAGEYTRHEMDRISREAAEIRQREMDRAREAVAAGEKHVEEAAGKIMEAVIPD